MGWSWCWGLGGGSGQGGTDLICVAHVKLARVLVGGERGPQQHDLTLKDLDRRAGGDARRQPLERLRVGWRERSERVFGVCRGFGQGRDSD